MLKNIISTFIGSLAAFFVIASIVVVVGTMFFTKFSSTTLDTLSKGAVISEIKDKSVLMLELGNISIVESTNPFETYFGYSDLFDEYRNLQLRDLINAIEFAAGDEKIVGIFLNLSNYKLNWATTEEIRAALQLFREKGKKVYCYSEEYNEKNYFLASVAHKIIMFPEGHFELNGLSNTPMFLSRLLKKLEIEPRIFRAGKFKGAVEPYIRENLSDESRAQEQKFLDDMWTTFTNRVGKARKLEVNTINAQATKGDLLSSFGALNLGLIDSINDRFAGLNELEFRKTNKINIWRYIRRVSNLSNPSNSKNIVALLNIHGEIVDGKSDEYAQITGSVSALEAIERIEKNYNVKGLVVRINSAGGSALASDVIFRRLDRLSIPVVVSMGDIAASGGYYIASAGTTIFANETTLTGSIGVFSVLWGHEKFSKNKIGITADRVLTHSHADIGNGFRPMDAKERKLIQNTVSRVYESFLSTVGISRDMHTEHLREELAGGRIWTGALAKQHGLVDEIGGLKAAITKVGEILALEDYKVVDYTYPEKSSLGLKYLKYLKYFIEGNVPNTLRKLSNELYNLESILTGKTRVFARMPYQLNIK